MTTVATSAAHNSGGDENPSPDGFGVDAVVVASRDAGSLPSKNFSG
jgi:hypothetical protein